MRNLIKKIRELPMKYSVILSVGLGLLASSLVYSTASEIYNSKESIRDLKIDLYQQRKKIQELKEFKELKKGFEDFQDKYYRRFQKREEAERVRYI